MHATENTDYFKQATHTIANFTSTVVLMLLIINGL